LQNQQISTNDKKVLRNLAAYLTFYNIPSPLLLKGYSSSLLVKELQFIVYFSDAGQPLNAFSLTSQGLPASTAIKFMNLFQS